MTNSNSHGASQQTKGDNKAGHGNDDKQTTSKTGGSSGSQSSSGSQKSGSGRSGVGEDEKTSHKPSR
jgi:hypothetical protein